jgi:hypothetical protein
MDVDAPASTAESEAFSSARQREHSAGEKAHAGGRLPHAEVLPPRHRVASTTLGPDFVATVPEASRGRGRPAKLSSSRDLPPTARGMQTACKGDGSAAHRTAAAKVLSHALGSDDAAALTNAAVVLNLPSVFPVSTIFAASHKYALPMPQVAIAAGRALPPGASAATGALEALSAVGAEFACMLAAEARDVAEAEQTGQGAAAAHHTAVGGVSAGGSSAVSPVRVEASHVVAALRALGYPHVAEQVAAAHTEVGVGSEGPDRPRSGSPGAGPDAAAAAAGPPAAVQPSVEVSTACGPSTLGAASCGPSLSAMDVR